MLLTKKKAAYLSLFLMMLIGLAIMSYWLFTTNSDSDFDQMERPLPGKKLTDFKPYEPVCDFWSPWEKLVAEELPLTYLENISKMLVDGADRTSQYMDLIMKDPGAFGALRGEAEEVCISGLFGTDDKYHLSAEKASSCKKDFKKFLEQSLKIKISPLSSGGFDNHIEYRLMAGRVVPKSFRAFWLGQLALLKKGYRGWSQAFPEYFKTNSSGFGLVGIEESPHDQNIQGINGFTSPFKSIQLDWLTQAMMSTQIDWATFLLKLGDLAKIEMWAEIPSHLNHNDKHDVQSTFNRRLLATKIETRLSSVQVEIPDDSAAFFAGIHEVPLVITHNILVKFRGIEILAKGLKYRGILHSDDSQFAFDGFFDGVDRIEISGKYRGIGMDSGVGKMIHQLVKEAIDREITRLKMGHDGKPAKLRIGLYKDGDFGVFELGLKFDAAVNVLNIIREEKDQVNSPVMPNKKTIKDLNQWARATFEALIRDYKKRQTLGTCAAISP